MFGSMVTPSDSTVPTPILPATSPLGSEDINRIVQETLDTFHDLRIEAIQGMGAIREIDRSLSKGIISEFLRLQLIVCNDLSKSLMSLRSEVRTLTQSLLRDLGLAIQSDRGTSSGSAVKAALQCFQDMMVLRMNLPLAQLDAARVDMDDFLDLRLREIRSHEESTRIVDALAKRVTEQHEKIKQVIQNAPLDDPRIAHRISIGLSAEQSLKVTLFPGMLEGLLGHLKIRSSDSEEAPHSMQAGAAKAWGEVVHEAAARSEIAQAFNGTLVESTLPPGLHVDYGSDFGHRHPAQVAEVFSDPQFLSETVRILFSLEQLGASPFSSPLKGSTTRAPMEPKTQLKPGPLASSWKSKQPSTLHQTGSHDVSIVMASTSSGVKATALTAKVMPHPPKSAPFQARLISLTLKPPTSPAASTFREDDNKTLMGGDFGDDDGDAIVMEGVGTEQDSAGASTVHQMSMTIEDNSDTDLFDDKKITNPGFEAAYSCSKGASHTNQNISSNTTELRCSDRNRSKDRAYQDDDDDIEEVPIKKARKDVSEDLKTLNDVRWGLYRKDFKSVDEVRACILKLDEGEPTRKRIETPPIFKFRKASSSSDESKSFAASIGKHWIPYLEKKGLLANCKPRDWVPQDGWLPLYKRSDVTNYVSRIDNLLRKDKEKYPLIAVVPPNLSFRGEKEYIIKELHFPDSLNRVQIGTGEDKKQVAFCPYCGVMSENKLSSVSHARKHLGIGYLCGGCFLKMYKTPSSLVTHLESCVSTANERDSLQDYKQVE